LKKAKVKKQITKPKRQALSKDKILRKALEIADAGGLASLSMRSLAKQLNVEAMSLYKHIKNKEDVLDGLADLVILEMKLAPLDANWKDAIHIRSHSAREVFRKHAWAPAIFESRIVPSVARLEYIENIFSILTANGFSITKAYRINLIVDSYVYGFNVQEANWRFDSILDEEIIESEDNPFKLVENYPKTFEFMKIFLDNKHKNQLKKMCDEDFQFGIEQIIQGIDDEL
jgi:AcrR family transcriptional regulator